MSEGDLVVVAELAHEFDRLMLEFFGCGLPGLHVLSAAHRHVVGCLAAICGPEGTEAHLPATAASVGRLPAKQEARTPVQALAAAKSSGHT